MKYTKTVSMLAALAAMFVLPTGTFSAEVKPTKTQAATPAPVKPKPRVRTVPKTTQYVAITVTKVVATPGSSPAMMAKGTRASSKLVKKPARRYAAKTVPVGTPMEFHFTIPDWVIIDPAHQVTLNLRCYNCEVNYLWKINRGGAAGLTEIELDSHTPSQWFPNSVPVVVQKGQTAVVSVTFKSAAAQKQFQMTIYGTATASYPGETYGFMFGGADIFDISP